MMMRELAILFWAGALEKCDVGPCWCWPADRRISVAKKIELHRTFLGDEKS